MQEKSVYVSLDEIGVVKQKESRKEPDRNSTAKYVENSAAHIEAKEGSYILTSQSIRGLLLSVIAFLLSNRLLDNQRLIFSRVTSTSLLPILISIAAKSPVMQ